MEGSRKLTWHRRKSGSRILSFTTEYQAISINWRQTSGTSAEDVLGGLTHKYKTDVVIQANGTNIWLAPAMFLTTCQLDVRYFPFDEQKCLLKFGSWTHDSSRLDMRTQTNGSNKDIYTEHGEWQLVGVEQKRNVKYYDCCPKPYVDISYTVHIRRKSLFYSLYLILPALLITSMVLVGFHLPPESGERMQLGITVLLAMIVFLQFVYQNLPSTSDSAPLLGKFYIVMMFLISLSLGCTCIILNYSHGYHGNEMPIWVRIIILDCLAKVFDSRPPTDKLGRFLTEADNQRRGEEWKRAARILDRFFMVAFSVMITLAIVALVLQAPSYAFFH
ncbi:neuronal acetylcholine receptor subunit alpha-10 isoform X2 [Nematostella vectensis]|uniref:neuronal acetylcholine receptor subunit alpha-10 isoform X2 n=1 Tax=Nematostella vectensis TaxID=45351 RepID=UPI0020770817|nr:neuronal acetylcholine receptor subunit alpha-10 isoform X2 [Nematostella vectensis]